ncbi:MAG: hypothetical protein KF773_22855 [Deltaproteobacteria bacterium]|nr:hypothetical protein [Deltaproteobacteria bacterium]
MTEADTITIVFTGEDNRDKLDESFGPEARTFPWSSIEFPRSARDALRGPDGVSVSLTDGSARVRFQQVYRETCNPAKEDLSPCWIYESYTSGEAGLTGTVALRIASVDDATQVLGAYDVSWEGLTDRFGDPLQMYGHETAGSVVATLLSGVVR